MKGYENYRDSKVEWLGGIPAHWELARGKYLFRTRKDINRWNQCSNVLSLTLDGVINNDIDNPIGLSPRDYASYQIFDKDNLVLKLIDLENISTSRVGLVHEHGIMSPAYIRLINRYDCNMRYFYFQYYDLYLRHVYNGLGNGVRSTLNAGDLLNIPIMIPPKDEQDQIARFLDWKITAIDKLISIRREELRNLAELKKALITREVTRGNWERVRLGSFCTFQNGISESGDFFTSGTPFVGYKDVYRHSELPETVSGVAMSNEKQQQIFSVQEGDIFFTRTSETIEEIGMAAVCKHTIDKAVFSGFLIRCRPQKNIVDIDYMKYYIQALSVRNYFSSQTNIVIRASLSQNLLKRLPVPLPPITEQKRIANYLDRICAQIDSAITNFTQQIDTLKELKACLISDAVTGKIDVRNIPVPEQEKIS